MLYVIIIHIARAFSFWVLSLRSVSDKQGCGVLLVSNVVINNDI